MVLETIGQIKKKDPRPVSEATRISGYGDISSISGTKMLSPFEHLLTCEKPQISELAEVIINWAQNNFGLEEFVEAKKEFHDQTGRVFPDDDFFNQRMSYFLDYFTFQRPVSKQFRDGQKSPYEQFMASSYLNENNAPSSIFEQFSHLNNHRHSLFKIVKIRKEHMILKDLFDKKRFQVLKSEKYSFHGFRANLIIQGFIFNTESNPVLSQGLVIHPINMNRIICKSIKAHKKTSEFVTFDYFAKLAKQNLNFIRYKFLDAKKFYSMDPR